MTYPQFFRVRQRWERPRVDDIPAAVDAELAKLRFAERGLAGKNIAIAVGSRGIAGLPLLVRSIAKHLLSLDARPFILPAMGSHGGGTAEGQRKLLEGYGVTEEFCGCPIRSSMETVVVEQCELGFPIHIARDAAGADGVVLCARVKSHTAYAGPFESGLSKMTVVGLGKQDGAAIFHRALHDYSFERLVRTTSARVIEHCQILGGIAVVENAYSELALVTAASPSEFAATDERLLTLAKKWSPRLPFPFVHILLIDEIGKDISGAGMDTNVVGRKFNDHAALPDEYPKVRRIIVRGLSPGSAGSPFGIGLAEFCKSSVLRIADWPAAQVNGITSGHMSAVAQPIHFETDRQLLDAALPTIGLTEPADAKVIWIKNTLDVAEVECSAAYLEEAKSRADLEVLSELRPLPFDAAGNLPLLQSVSEVAATA